MFSTLMSWLQDAWEWIWEGIKGIFGKIFEWCHAAWLIMVTVISWVWWVFDQIKQAIVTLVSLIGAAVWPTNTASESGLSSFLSMANTFFPLTELFAFIVAYGLLLIALATYRFIKSWIPWGS